MSNFTGQLLISIETRLQDADPGIRRVAVMELVDSPEPEAVELLITALSDSEADVRMEAAKVIDEFEPIDMMDALVEARTAPDENVRNAAASALADLKDKSVAPALLEALKKDDVFVLSAVLRALKQLRIKDARSLRTMIRHSPPKTAAQMQVWEAACPLASTTQGQSGPKARLSIRQVLSKQFGPIVA